MDDYEHSLQELFMRVVHGLFTNNFKRLSQMNVHPGQVMLIKTLLENSGISQKEIADLMGVKSSTVAVSIKRMEKSGLLYRENDLKDRRVWRVYLTEEGKSLAGQFKVTHQGNDEILFHGFTDADKVQLRVYLERIYNNILDSKDGKEEDV